MNKLCLLYLLLLFYPGRGCPQKVQIIQLFFCVGCYSEGWPQAAKNQNKSSTNNKKDDLSEFV